MTAAARPRRADATRNAARVLAAAREVFAEKGADASIGEIATRASVGKATVYRGWPTKVDLLVAVAGARVEEFTALVRGEVASGGDPWTSLHAVVHAAVESQLRNALLCAGPRVIPETSLLRQQRADYRAALQELLDQGKQCGQVRADAAAGEVITLINGVARTLHEQSQQDLVVWRRFADLILDSFRP